MLLSPPSSFSSSSGLPRGNGSVALKVRAGETKRKKKKLKSLTAPAAGHMAGGAVKRKRKRKKKNGHIVYVSLSV